MRKRRGRCTGFQAGLLSSDYAAQKQALDDAPENAGKSICVGSHALVQGKDDSMPNYSVLSEMGGILVAAHRRGHV